MGTDISIYVFRSRSKEKADVPRPEPEGAINYDEDQPPNQPLPADDFIWDEDEAIADDKTPLLKDEAAIADAGIQPSLTRLLAPDNLMPGDEDAPQQPLISIGPSEGQAALASASMHRMSSDTALSPSQTSVVSETRRRRLTDVTDDSYVDSDGDHPLTRMAIQTLQRNWLQKQMTDTSTDDGKRQGAGDSGRHFPAMLRTSVTPESIVADTTSPGRSSSSTFLFDSESSESDVGVLRTSTLRSIAKMKRKRLQKMPPRKVLAREPESAVTDAATTPMSVRARSRSRTPLDRSSVARTPTAPSSPAVLDAAPPPATVSPAPPAQQDVKMQLDSQTAPVSRTATPIPGTPTQMETQPTAEGTQSPEVSYVSQPVQVTVDKLKDVQKTERTDSEGRKTTVYKLNPKSSSLFSAPMWPPFAAPASSVRSTLLDRGASLPTAGFRLSESTDTPAKEDGARYFDIRRSTEADQQTIDRLKALADQRGENMLQASLQEIQGTTSRPQVRSADLARLAALREPLTKTAADDSSLQGRLTYAPIRTEQPPIVDATHYQPQTNGIFRFGAANSLSNFSYLAGERPHTDLMQRSTFDVSVPHATNDANIAASQFLQGRFSQEKKCFQTPQDFLNKVHYEGLQPETRSLLNRVSSAGAKSAENQQMSEVQRIRSSFQYHSSDQHLSPAQPDYPQQPSTSKLAQTERRLLYMPSVAQPDQALQPSLSRITPHQTVDLSKPDEYLHPSLHRMHVTPSLIPATAGDALHLSDTQITSVMDVSKPDDFLHPSLHRIAHFQGDIPARPDDALYPSDTKLSSSTHHIAKYDEAQRPSLSRLLIRDVSQRAEVPAKADDYLHPSLTRVQQKPITSSGKLRSDLESTTTTTTVMDREYLLFEEPATPDEYLHPSLTRIVSGRTQLPSAVPAVPDDVSHPSSTRMPTAIADARQIVTQDAKTVSSARQDYFKHRSSTSVPSVNRVLRSKTSDKATSATAIDRKETPARPDDILHPSSTQFKRETTIDTSTSTVDTKASLSSTIARPDDVLHPSSTYFAPHESALQQRESTAANIDAATSTTILGNNESLPKASSATLDDALRSQFPLRESSKPRITLDSATSTTTVGVKDTLPPESARPDDTVHHSTTVFTPIDRARVTTDGATSSAEFDRKETYQFADYNAYRKFPPRDSVRTSATVDATTSTTAAASKGTLAVDDTLHPSTAQLPRDSTRATAADVSTSTAAVGENDTRSSVSARPDDILHPSSTRFTQRDSARVTRDSATSTEETDRKETHQATSTRENYQQFQRRQSVQARSSFDATTSTTSAVSQDISLSARPDGIPHSSSTQFPPHGRMFSQRDTAQASFDSAASASAFGTRGTSAASESDDIVRSSTTHMPPYESSRRTVDMTSTLTVDKEKTSSAPAGPDEKTHLLGQRQSAKDTVDSAALSRAQTFPSVPARPDDILHPSSTQFNRVTTMDTSTSTGDRKASLSSTIARLDDVLHPSSTQVRPPDSTRISTDRATSAVAVDRKGTLTSVPARADDISHPSATRVREDDRNHRPTFDTATSMTGFDDKGAALSSRSDDIRRQPSQFSAQDSGATQGSLDRSSSSYSHVVGYDDRRITQSEEWTKDVPSTIAFHRSLKHGSDPSEEEYQRSPFDEPEVSYPSEFLHPSWTGVAVDSAVNDNVERPSSLKLTDQDNSRKDFLSSSGLVIDDEPREDAIETEDDSRLSNRESVIRRDETRSDRTGWSGEMHRSSIQSVRGRPTAPSARATLPQTSTVVESKRPRRTVTWDLRPRATSEVDARIADSVSSVGQRSLPNMLDLASSFRAATSATSASTALRSDGRKSSEWTKSATSDEPLAKAISARDSRIVTREHIAKKKTYEELDRSDEHYYDTADELVHQRQLEPDEDRSAQHARSTHITPWSASDEAIRRTPVGPAAAADDFDVSEREYHRFDSSSAAVDESLSPSVVDFQTFAETEDWLLRSPSASVSRPPSQCIGEDDRDLAVYDDRHRSLTDACATSHTPCRPTTASSLSSRHHSGHDITSSATFCYVDASGREHQLLAPSYVSPLTPTSRVELFPGSRCPEPLDASRTFANRLDNTYCYSRPTSAAVYTRGYGRNSHSTDVGVYRSPFARGFVPSNYRSHGSTYNRSCQPCQPSPQPSTQQV